MTVDRTYQQCGRQYGLQEYAGTRTPRVKKISKTQAVTSNLKADLADDDVHIGPSDYVAWLDDRKWAFVRLERSQLW